MKSLQQTIVKDI